MVKKWMTRLLVVLVIGVVGGWAYQTRQTTHAGESITAVGSTALQPLVEAAGEQYTADHTGVFINVQGGGSGTGLSQIQADAVAIGNSDVFAEEQAGITSKRLVDHRVAVVGIAPIINRQAGVKNLSTEQLIAVFTGKITNWRQVGGRNQKVVLVNRSQGSGTRKTFEQWGLKGHQSTEAQEQDSSGMVRSIVSSTPGAISYVAFSYINKSVQELRVNGIRPTETNVKNNRWQIWSYEHMYTNGQPTGLTKDFMHYILSSPVQQTLVKQLGYIPVAAMHVERDVRGQVTKK